MKIILSLLILLSACKSGPQKDTVSIKDFEAMQGNWVGIQTVLNDNDSTGFNYPSKLKVTLLNDSLELNITNTYADGHQETEKGILSIDKSGRIISLGASEYEIKNVVRIKEEFSILAYKDGEDNDKPATIRLQIMIRPMELGIFRNVKYKGAEDHFNFIHLTVTKK